MASASLNSGTQPIRLSVRQAFKIGFFGMLGAIVAQGVLGAIVLLLMVALGMTTTLFGTQVLSRWKTSPPTQATSSATSAEQAAIPARAQIPARTSAARTR